MDDASALDDIDEIFMQAAVKMAKNHTVDLDKDLQLSGMTLSELIFVIRGRGCRQFLEDPKYGTIMLDEFRQEYEIYKYAIREIRIGSLSITNEETIIIYGRSYPKFWLNPLVFLEWADEKRLIPNHMKTHIKAFYRRHDPLFKKEEPLQVLLDLLADLSKEEEHRDTTAPKLLQTKAVEPFLNKHLSSTQWKNSSFMKRLATRLVNHEKFSGKKNKKWSKSKL